jgi:hypothetical protein
MAEDSWRGVVRQWWRCAVLQDSLRLPAHRSSPAARQEVSAPEARHVYSPAAECRVKLRRSGMYAPELPHVLTCRSSGAWPWVVPSCYRHAAPLELPCLACRGLSMHLSGRTPLSPTTSRAGGAQLFTGGRGAVKRQRRDMSIASALATFQAPEERHVCPRASARPDMPLLAELGRGWWRCAIDMPLLWSLPALPTRGAETCRSDGVCPHRAERPSGGVGLHSARS